MASLVDQYSGSGAGLVRPEPSERNEAITTLRAFIVGGSYTAGDRLPPERELIGALAMSRTTLRKALDALEREGVIWRHVGKGTFVAGHGGLGGVGNISELAQQLTPVRMIRARLCVEPAITREAAINASREAIIRIRLARDRARGASGWDDYEAQDDLFHRAVAEASDNILLVALFDQLNQVRRAVAWGNVVRGSTRVAFYFVLLRGHLKAPFGDMRSGLFVSVAEWAAKQTADLPPMQERAWKPNLLVPTEDTEELKGSFLMLHDLAAPRGSVKLMGLRTDQAEDRLEARVYGLSNAFKDRGVFASWSVLESPMGFGLGAVAGMQALRGAFFKPNILYLTLPEDRDREEDFQRILEEAAREEMGVVIHAPHPSAEMGQRRMVNIWIRDRSPDWSLSMDIGNLDLPLLLGYKLMRAWNARLRLLSVLEREEDVEKARSFLDAVLDLGRIPNTQVRVLAGEYDDYLPQAPQADVSIFGLGRTVDFDFIRRMVNETGSTCLFARDSGRESALA